MHKVIMSHWKALAEFFLSNKLTTQAFYFSVKASTPVFSVVVVVVEASREKQKGFGMNLKTFQLPPCEGFFLPIRTHWPLTSSLSSSEKKYSQSPSPARITNSLPGSMKMNAAFVKSASASIASLRTVMALRRNLRVASSLFLSFAWFPSFPHRFVISLPRTPDDISTTSIILSRGKS